MPYVKEDDYKKGNYTYPPDKIPFKNKDEKWHLRYAEAILGEYFNNNCGIHYSDVSKMLENRQFGAGTESTDRYKNIYFEWQQDEAERMGWTNINFENTLRVIPIFRAVFLGIMASVQHRISAKAIDPFSVRKKNLKKGEIWFNKIFADYISENNKKLGIPEVEKNEYVPETKEELNMFFELGGYKLAYEAAIEMAMDHTLYISEWDSEIKDQVNGDLFDNKRAAVKDYLDRATMKVKQRYVDPLNGIVQYSKSNNFDNSRYFGEYIDMNLLDIRLATEGQPGWDENRYLEICKLYNNQNGNIDIFNWSNDTLSNNDGTYRYDQFKIKVADLEWASLMYDYDKVSIDKYGNERLTKGKFGKTDYQNPNKKGIETGVKVWHKCKLIVGTKYIFDYGIQNDIPRPVENDPKSSFHFIKLSGKSHVELSKGCAEQIVLNFIQLQNHIAKAAPPGLIVEWQSLQNIVIGGKVREPLEILKIGRQTGDYIYKATTMRGHINIPAGSPPIQAHGGGVSAEIMKFTELIEYNLDKIRNFTGINKVADASSPEERVSVEGSKLALMSTNNALKLHYKAYLSLLERSAINCVARLRDLLAISEEARNIYSSIIGKQGIDIFEVFKEHSASNLSVKIEAQPTEEDKENIRMKSIEAMNAGILSFGASMLVDRLLNAGNLKYAEAFMNYMESKAKKEAMAAKTQNEESNGQIQLAALDKKKNDMIEIEAAKGKIEVDTEKELSKIRDAEDQKKHDREMERIRLEKSFETKNPVAKTA